MIDGFRVRLAGRWPQFRPLNVVDDSIRGGLAMDVVLSLPAERVTCARDQLIERRGAQRRIQYDDGPEYIAYTQNA